MKKFLFLFLCLTSFIIFVSCSKEQYNILYDLDGGTCSNLITSFEYGDEIILPTPFKENYEFVGWYEKDTLITEINENRDYNLKALWNKNIFYITYDLDGGSCDDLTYSFSKNNFIELKEPKRLDYKFLGWFEEDVLITEINENRDYNLKALWNKNIFYITYDLDGGSCDDLTYSFSKNNFIELKEPKRLDYKFLGWFEEDVLITEINENRDYNLKAKWEEIKVHSIYLNHYLDFGIYSFKLSKNFPTDLGTRSVIKGDEHQYNDIEFYNKIENYNDYDYYFQFSFVTSEFFNGVNDYCDFVV